MSGDNTLSERFGDILRGKLCGATVIDASFYVDYYGEVSVNEVVLRTESFEVVSVSMCYPEERAVLKRYVGPRDKPPSAGPRQPGEWVEIAAGDYWREL